MVLGLAQNGLVPAEALVPAALLDDVAQVQAPAPVDVLDAAPRPRAVVRHALLAHEVGHLAQRTLGQLVEYTAHDGCLTRIHDQLARVDETAGDVAQAVVSERIVAPVAAILEQAPLEGLHSLGVEVALELGGSRKR